MALCRSTKTLLNVVTPQDKDTAEKLCNELVNHVESVESPPVLRSLLTSLGQMKYLHTPLVDAIMTWYFATLPLVPQLPPLTAAGTAASVWTETRRWG